LTHSINTTAGSYRLELDLTNALTVNTGGLIDVSERGYAATGGLGGSTTTAGAAYGGYSGRGISDSPVGPYSSHNNPDDLGSGAKAAAGGGLVRVSVPMGTI